MVWHVSTCFHYAVTVCVIVPLDDRPATFPLPSAGMATRPGRGGDVPILEADRLGRTSSVSVDASTGQFDTSPPHSRNVMLRDAAVGYSDRLMHAYKQKDRVLATAEGREEELRAYSQASGTWRFYRTLCQVRFGYLAFLVVMMVLIHAAHGDFLRHLPAQRQVRRLLHCASRRIARATARGSLFPVLRL
jgi:hypothetical protein